MALLTLTVNLLVADVATSVDFYTDVLGFELVLGVPEGTEDVVFDRDDRPLGFAMLERDEVQIMIQSHTSAADDLPGFTPSAGGDAVSLYIDVDDVEALWEQLREKVDVVKPLGTTFYGAKEFHFRDPAGFLVGLASRPEHE